MIPNGNKRIKLDIEEKQKNALILSEIDVEIGLRKRLATTLESRIKWASLLIESLQNNSEYYSEIPFKDAALAALSTLESSSDILFARDVEITPPNAHNKGRLPLPKEKPLTRSQKSKFLYLRSPDSAQIFLLRCPFCNQSTFSTLQGLYNHARLLHSIDWGSHEECVKACAVSQENLDAELDLEAGVDAGRASTLLPGVRSLFQMAVEGTRDEKPDGRVDDDEEETTKSILLTKTLGLHSDSPALAQFLGKEVKRKGIRVWDDGEDVDITNLDDDPSILKRRWKKPVAQQKKSSLEEELVITAEKGSRLGTTNSSSLSHPTAASSRFHISCRVTITDKSLFIPEEQRLPEKKDHTHQWMISAESASYSLDLTTVLTSLTVSPIPSFDSAPAVSFPPLVVTDPPFVVVGTTSEPFQAQIVLVFNSGTGGSGQNGQKVFLEHWIGLDMIGTNKLPTKGDEQVVDIELDKDTGVKPVKTGYTPVNAKSHWESASNIMSGKKDASKKLNKTADENAIPGSYTELLSSLLVRFPMTLQDSVSKTPPNVPYKLLPDSTQLKALVMGRRKMIEWSRARAIQGAYTDRVRLLREREPCSHLIALTSGDVYAWLDDNGHFIRDPGQKEVNELGDHLDDSAVMDYSEGRWCRVCGLGLWAHGTPGMEYVKAEAELAAAHAAQYKDSDKKGLPRIRLKLLSGQVVVGGGPGPPPKPPPFQCQIVDKMLQLMKMPIVDVLKIFAPRVPKGVDTTSASLLNPRQLPPWSSRTYILVKEHHTLVSAVDPQLILGVRSLVNTLQLPSFASSLSSRLFLLESTGNDAAEVVANLSAHALLALAARRFIRVLIKEATEVEKRDKELGVGLLFETHNRDVSLLASGLSSRKYKTATAPRAGRKGKEKEKVRLQSIKVLTPMHIITGVISNYVRATALASVPTEGNRPSANSDGDGGNVGIAMFGCLSRIGIGVEEKRDV